MAKRSASSDLNRDNYEDDDVVEEAGTFRTASESQLKGRVIKKAKRRQDAMGGNAPVFTNFTGFGASNPSAPPSFSFGEPAAKSAASSFNFGTKKDTPPSTFKTDETSKENKSPSNFSLGAKLVSPPACLKLSPSMPSSNFSSFGSASSNGDSMKGKFSFSSPLTPADTSTKSQSSSEEASPLVETNKNPSSDSSENSSYLRKLKALNNQALKWITEHVNKNPYINLSPIFQDYTNHINRLKSQKSKEAQLPKPAVEKPKEQKLQSSVPTSFEPKSILKESATKPELPYKVPEPLPTKSSVPSSQLFTFGTSTTQSTSSFGETKSTSSSGFSFGTSNTSSTFSFGDKSSAPVAGGFSFGGVTPAPPQPEAKEEDEPPVVEVKEITEEGSTYEKKVKLFYKKDDSYVEKGVGMLFLKPAGEKTQLIVRALNNLGNILLNIVLNSSIPTQRMGKNNVMIVCVPNPPLDPKEGGSKPTSMLIRVKTSDDADDLLKKLEESKQ